MSWDVVVFDAEAAPRMGKEFREWFNAQLGMQHTLNVNDPEVTTPKLRAFFLDIIKKYPAMNGPYAKNPLPETDKIVGYSFSPELIYADFRWSALAAAWPLIVRLSKRHQVGLFNISSNVGEIWFPNNRRGLYMGLHFADSKTQSG